MALCRGVALRKLDGHNKLERRLKHFELQCQPLSWLFCWGIST